MSKNSRKISKDANDSNKDPKRRCSLRNKARVEHSEPVLWPETEESFLSNSKLDALLTKALSSCSSASSNSAGFHDNQDDSIFSAIDLPKEIRYGVDSTTLTQAIINRSNCSISLNPLFADFEFESPTGPDDKLLLPDSSHADEYPMQNTQQFLHDMTVELPKVAGLNKSSANKSLMAHSVFDGCVPGTQYATHEEIQNLTLGKTAHQNFQLSMNLTAINWETQAFPEEDTFPSKGEFYGLPDKVKRMILEHKGIQDLYEWQDECLNLPAIRKRTNLIYALPTSGGKTLVAEILILRELICRQRNVLFVLPYVSIVQEKVSSMSPFAIALDFIVEEYTAGKGRCPPVARKKRKSIFIASIEKAAVLMDSLIDAERANEIGLVVVDELHLIGEKGRGATLEALLTKVLFLNANIQIVGMSATIGNINEISAFLKADVYTRGFRPVELKEYIKCGNDILEINTAGKSIEDVFVFSRSVNFKYSEAVTRSDPDHLGGLVTECAPKNCCLVFCATRKSCENVALLFSRILPKSKFLEYRKKEKEDLMDALDKVCGILSPVLAKTIPYGVAYHHSGLTTDERKFIETAYRFGVISVICCTSTLAAGVNLPAKRVIIRAPYVGSEFMTLCKYKQMVGRAGRAGLGEAGESILICSSRDNLRVGEMLFSPMDKAMTSLGNEDAIGVQALILSAIGLGLADCCRDLQQLLSSTLLAVQAEEVQLQLDELVMKIIREMFKNRVLQIATNDKRNSSDIITTQDLRDGLGEATQTKDRRLLVSKTTRFQLTTIGKASFKAGIDYKRAQGVYVEIKAAQKQLILTNYAHLLYLVVSFNSNAKGDELFAADAPILFREYTTVDETTQKLFKQLNFTEAQAAKLAKTGSVSGAMELTLNRLFKVLILEDIINMMPIPAVAHKFNLERGILQNLISQSIAAASAIVRLCEQIEEFWCFKPLFEHIGRKMDRCGTVELDALLELPAVKINRAKQLYAAGFKTIEDIAKCRPIELAKAVEHMPFKIAKEIVSAAKIILMKKLDFLEEETEALKMCLRQDDNSPVSAVATDE